MYRHNRVRFPNRLLTARLHMDGSFEYIVNPFEGTVGQKYHVAHNNASPDIAHIVTNWLILPQGQHNLQT